MRDLRFGFRFVVKLYVVAERVEKVAAIVELERRAVRDGVTVNAPQENPDIRNVVLATLR